MRCCVNAALSPTAVAPPSDAARPFHQALPGYAPTPLRPLAVPGLAGVAVKDETSRLGLPAFKVLGAAWAVERALRERPGVELVVTASAGNHGRAVARVARERGLRCRVLLPARALPARRAAIASEGAEVVVVDGTYEDAVRAAAEQGAGPGALELADVGASGPARWVIDGYATLFAELGDEPCDLLVVPVGVGALAAAAARWAAHRGVRVIGAEPVTAACLTASLAAGRPVAVPTPGTAMAGLDCAEVSPAAWPDLRAGVAGTVCVADGEAAAARDELRRAGIEAGDAGAAPLAALHVLLDDPACAALVPDPGARVVLVVTEGPTDRFQPMTT